MGVNGPADAFQYVVCDMAARVTRGFSDAFCTSTGIANPQRVTICGGRSNAFCRFNSVYSEHATTSRIATFKRLYDEKGAHMKRWFPVNTERLLLREPLLADEADIHEYASDPLVPRYDSWGPNTVEQTREVLHRWTAAQQTWPRHDIHLAAELRHERKVIGSVRLWIGDEANRMAEIGYTFNRRYWNNGYATEAASVLLAQAFLALNAHRVVATCDTRNVGSWKVMEKIGLRREGHFLHDKLQKGEWRDTYLYAILAEEWSERQRLSR